MLGDLANELAVELPKSSAPLKELQKKFGFTFEAVVEAATTQLARR